MRFNLPGRAASFFVGFMSKQLLIGLVLAGVLFITAGPDVSSGAAKLPASSTRIWKVDSKPGVGELFLTQEQPFYDPAVMNMMRRFERLMYENLGYGQGKTAGVMTNQNVTDFDVNALYAALDAERQSRGLSWQQVAQEISRQFEHTRATPISSPTLLGLREKSVIEGDGVLQMLRWLRRTPESFVPGLTESEDAALPQIGSDQILRFDAKAIYEALSAQRSKRGMTWKQVADEIGGVNASGLTRLANGGRVGFPDVMRVFRWLGRPAAAFTRASDW